MEIEIYQIDAFAGKPFAGNPAAVCPLDKWLPDKTLLAIAEENNLSETAFFVGSKSPFEIRWFTPVTEVELCGHATLATAFVIFENINSLSSDIIFSSRSGALKVTRRDHLLTLNFPSTPPVPIDVPGDLIAGLGKSPVHVLGADDYFAVFDHEDDIIELEPDFAALSKLDLRGVIATSRGNEYDFVSRFFAPKYGIPEDPVTGSAHCALTPYWSKVLNKPRLTAKQISRRGGVLGCEMKGDRVHISGQAVQYLKGKIVI